MGRGRPSSRGAAADASAERAPRAFPLIPACAPSRRPRQYFFNDHPSAGVRSFDYIYSLIGVIQGALFSCMLICTVPMQLKALLCGGDDEGGMGMAGITLGGLGSGKDV